MVKPLTFKGDKRTRKRKRLFNEGTEASSSKAVSTSDTKFESPAEYTDNDDSWVSADSVADVSGPVIFVLPTEGVTCLACDVNGKIFASEIKNVIDGDPTTAEPHDVRQVWVANRVAGTEFFSFKSYHGRYLSCERFGILSATHEAIGPTESFQIIAISETSAAFSLQTQRGTFITISVSTGLGVAPEIRGDADTILSASTLRIRIQARFKPRFKASKETKARERISRKELEDLVGRRLDDEEVKVLKRARREGNFHEKVLDVKVKGKHDKFA